MTLQGSRPEVRRILVAGGAGLVGAHLCEELIRRGHHVTCVDDLAGGSPEALRNLFGEPRFRFVRRKVSEPLPFAVDEIYHLGFPPPARRRRRQSLDDLKTSTLATLNLLEHAALVGAPVLLAAPPRDEAASEQETLVKVYRHREGVDARIARVFDVYGPGAAAAAKGDVVSQMICEVLRGGEIVLDGTGQRVLRLCWVGDVVQGLVRLMEAPGFDEPVDLGSPHEVSILDLAEMIARLSKKSLHARFRPHPAPEAADRVADLKLARERLGWEPSTDLASGLARTIAFFEERVGRACAPRRPSPRFRFAYPL